MSTQTDKMREALKLALYYLVEPTTVTLEYVPPASAMRRAADAFEKKEADIRTIQNLFAELDAHPSQPIMDSTWMTEGCRETWAAAGYNDKERAAERFRQGPYQAWACGWMESRAKLIGSGIYAHPSQTEDLEARAREWLSTDYDVELQGSLEDADTTHEVMTRMLAAFARTLSAPKEVETVPCPHLVNGSCPLHNLHCQYPKCTQPRTR